MLHLLSGVTAAAASHCGRTLCSLCSCWGSCYALGRPWTGCTVAGLQQAATFQLCQWHYGNIRQHTWIPDQAKNTQSPGASQTAVHLKLCGQVSC